MATDLVSYTLRYNPNDEDKPVLIDALDDRNRSSRRQVRKLVHSLIDALRNRGIKPGDTVCLHMFNHIHFPALFLAIVGAGAKFTASNPAYTEWELVNHLRLSDTSWIITEHILLSNVHGAIRHNGLPCGRVLLHTEDSELESSCSSHATLSQLLDDAAGKTIDNGTDQGPEDGPDKRLEDRTDKRSDNRPDSGSDMETDRDIDTEVCAQPGNYSVMSPDTIATLSSTSGTTGLPKMAARSHYSLIIEAETIEDSVPKPYEIRRLLSIPFFHAFAAPLALINALRFGHTTYVMRRFDQTQYLDAIQRFDITETAMPPPLIFKFQEMPVTEREMLKSLRQVWCGGAPLSATVQNKALDMFAPDARIVQVWGMTETGWLTTFKYPEFDTTGSVGRLVSSYQARVVDEIGNVLQPNHLGEILVQGPATMAGYIRNPDANTLIFRDGWLRTGDLGYIDEDNKIYIVDRLKELIKVRGWQVAPAEIEGRLLEHPSIIDAAVIGVFCREKGTEIPRVHVVYRQDYQPLTSEILMEYLKQSLARYKVSDCEFYTVASIPRSASGKILRRLLRDQFE